MLLQLFVQDSALIDTNARQTTLDLLEGVQPDTVLLESEYAALLPWVQACRAAQLPFGGFFDDLLLPAAHVGAALQALCACFPTADKQSPVGKMLWLLEFATEQKASVVAERTRLLGFSHVEWREVGEEEAEEEHWEQNKTCPQVGESRWAKIPADPEFREGQRAWLLFRPTLAFLNGWEMHPEMLEQSVLCECEIKQVILYSNWAQVVCHRTMPLAEIPQHFPATHHAPPPVDYVSPNAYREFAETELLIYQQSQDSSQEAPLEWWVTTKTTPPRLVLYSLEFWDDPFEIHNAILPD